MNTINQNALNRLYQKHCRAVNAGQSPARILELLCNDEWFTDRIETTVRYFLRRNHLPYHLVEDIRQDVFLHFAIAIENDPSFGCHESIRSYKNFLRAIIFRSCDKSVRRKSVSTTSNFKESDHPLVDDQDLLEDLIDLHEAIGSLSSSCRDIMQMICDGMSAKQISQKHGCHFRTVNRWIRDSTKQMQEFCLREPRSLNQTYRETCRKTHRSSLPRRTA
jgi:RNA polymerase sigma factor (sigma-70 family)